MFRFHRSWAAVIAAGLVLAVVGCQEKNVGVGRQPRAAQKAALRDRDDAAGNDDDTMNNEDETPSKSRRAASTQKPQEPAQPPTIPKVNLSDELRANCLVKVGDVLPKAELPDLSNKEHSLASLYGKKLTVVFVWTGATRRALLEAADMVRSLTNDVAKPFQTKGVEVIGIEVMRNDVDLDAQPGNYVAEATFPHLLDDKGQFLGSICKDGKLPKVFLLDAKGKILWFDVEYSRATREDLVQGIRVALGELK